MFADCLHCQTRVVPKKDGTCPACRERIAAAPGAPKPSPAKPAAAGSTPLTAPELSLLRMLYAGVEVRLNPDGPGPRKKLADLLDRFKRGEV